MSIAVLIQVQEEVRRLAIAGSAVAPGDFRLKKLIAPLEQSGAKAPVFAKIAQATQAVVESNDKTASVALLDLASLVNAVLYTQGETGITGEITPIESVDLGGSETQTAARVLKPLLEALSSTGSGRVEIVQNAVERGVFRDLRLVKPAIAALDDPYPDIGTLIAKKVLPMYGKAIVPELITAFDHKGRGGHVHRLRLIHTIDPEAARTHVLRSLEEGSKEIRVAAIECLGTTGSDLGYLLEQTKAKAKDVRGAALRALSTAELSADVLGVITRAIDGDDIDLITEQLRNTKHAQLRAHVLSRADEQLTKALSEKDTKKQGPAISRLQQLFRGINDQEDSTADAFMLRSYESMPALAKIKSTPSGTDYSELLADRIASGTSALRERLAAAHSTFKGNILHSAIFAARETMTPANFYKEFSPLLSGRHSKSATEREKAGMLGCVLQSNDGKHSRQFILDLYTMGLQVGDTDTAKKCRELDPRWLDAAIDSESLDLVRILARPDHAGVKKYLSGMAAAADSDSIFMVLEAMVRIKHSGAADAIIATITKQSKSPRTAYYTYWFNGLISALPKEASPKFEALLPTLPEKMVGQLIDSVTQLKNKQDET